MTELPMTPSPMPGEDVVDIDDVEPGEEMPTAPLPDIDDDPTPSEVQ